MGRKATIQKNRVYVECTDAGRRVKGYILSKNEMEIKVELPTGFVMELKKKHRRGFYTFQSGLLEFVSDGKAVV
jgi:hypothetical protein